MSVGAQRIPREAWDFNYNIQMMLHFWLRSSDSNADLAYVDAQRVPRRAWVLNSVAEALLSTPRLEDFTNMDFMRPLQQEHMPDARQV